MENNLGKAIDEAEQKILDMIEVAVSSEKYVVLKRHIQDAFGRSGLRGKLGLERKGRNYEQTNRKPNEGVSKSNTVYETKRSFPSRGD